MPTDRHKPAEDDWTVRFAEQSMDKAEYIQRKEGSNLQWLEGAREISISHLDALTVMLIIELVLLPMIWLLGSDLLLILVYALALTGASFVVFFFLEPRLDRRIRERRTLLKMVDVELEDMKKVRNKRAP